MTDTLEQRIERRPTALLSIAATAEELGVGRRTVERLLANGELRPVKIGRRTLISPDELARFIRSRTAESAVTEPVTMRQLSAIHARADELDRLAGSPRGTSKAALKAWVSEHLGREIESFNDLTVTEASSVLDQLGARLELVALVTDRPAAGRPTGQARQPGAGDST